MIHFYYSCFHQWKIHSKYIYFKYLRKLLNTSIGFNEFSIMISQLINNPLQLMNDENGISDCNLLYFSCSVRDYLKIIDKNIRRVSYGIGMWAYIWWNISRMKYIFKFQKNYSSKIKQEWYAREASENMNHDRMRFYHLHEFNKIIQWKKFNEIRLRN